METETSRGDRAYQKYMGEVKAGKVIPLSKAVKMFCDHCVGNNPKMVTKCCGEPFIIPGSGEFSGCPLIAVRGGKTRLKKNLTAKQRDSKASRARSLK